jgi:hypothetical protein
MMVQPLLAKGIVSTQYQSISNNNKWIYWETQITRRKIRTNSKRYKEENININRFTIIYISYVVFYPCI